jgi:ADP-heptose:LPS heptosyltransferase
MTSRPPERILVVKLSSLGDVVHVTGCLRAMRTEWPRAEITIAVEARFAALVRTSPYVDRVVATRTGGSAWTAWREARRLLDGPDHQRFDLAIDFQGLPRSAAWTYASGARVKAGRGGTRPGWQIVHRPDLARHAVSVCRDVARAAEISVDDPTPELSVEDGADHAAVLALAEHGMPADGFLVVNPFSVWPSKEWPIERYAAAIDALGPRLGVPIVIIGGPGEEARGAELRRSIRAADVAMLAGVLPLDQALAVYRRAALMLTGDSGPMHAAAALGTRVVALFGPTFPERTGPWGPDHVVIQASRPSDHHTYRRDADRRHIGAITVDAVVEAVTRAYTAETRRALAGRRT